MSKLTYDVVIDDLSYRLNIIPVLLDHDTRENTK